MPKVLSVDQVSLSQQLHARVTTNLSMVGIPIANGRTGRGVTMEAADVRSPQVFVGHPIINYIDPSSAGVDFAALHLPGRPPAGWDGEPGAGAPVGQY